MNEQPNEPSNAPSESRPQPLYVTLILDETGSMQECKGAAIAGFNQYVAALRQEPAETLVTLTLFNSRKTEVRYQATPVARVHDLDVETYRPRDTTPLYDAIGRTLTAARLQVPPESRRLCVILTDGEENASRNYTRAQIFDMIKAYEDDGWMFLYLGADHDVWAAGEELGVAEHNRITFLKENVDHTFVCLSEATARYRRRDKSANGASEPDHSET
jgi:Mg-chelatase subunit ChlD